MESDPIVDRGKSEAEAAEVQLVIEAFSMEERRRAALKAQQEADRLAYPERPDWEERPHGFTAPPDYPGSTAEYEA